MDREYEALIHDMANPLVVVAACVEELQLQAESMPESQADLVNQAAEAAAALEALIAAARRRLQAVNKPDPQA